ncbi:MAG: hypothetical protein IKV43_02025, partial [Clostridia bacterium]|nr:hypothetical protein [Clostridia bacterium]
AVTAEALALRVDELEKQVSMLKMGVGTGTAVQGEATVTVLPPVRESDVENSIPDEAPTAAKSTVKAENNDAKPTAPAEEPKKTVVYAAWGKIVERISELKPSLSVQFQKSKAYVRPDGTYVIRMNSFFADRLAKSENDLKILRGVISEREGCDPSGVKLVIEPIDASNRGFADELADNIDG